MITTLYKYYQNRIRILVSFVMILNFILLFKIFTIQILNHEKYLGILSDETTLITKKTGIRGKILDRNHIELAQNIKKFDFWVNTMENFDCNSIATLFSTTFNKNEEYYKNLLEKKHRYVMLEKNIEGFYCKNILTQANNHQGLRYNALEKRFYPYDNLLSNVIGFVGVDEKSSAGIEYYFNKILEGEEIDVLHNILDNGQIIPYDNNIKIKSGKNIITTIDLELQSILYSELKKGVQNAEALSGNGIILDPNTGEILAMVSIPDFNSNNFNDFEQSNYKNRVISENYEPGSTYKIVALTSAIENAIVTLEDSIYCENGSYILKNGHSLHDHEPYGYLSISDLFAYSSNIGVAKIADLITSEQLYNTSRKFGFGVKTGILLPNEESGSLKPVEKWSYLSNKTIAIGQEMSSTTLQIAMAYSVIANGGYLLQPYIIKNIENGNISESYPRVIRRVISKSTSLTMIDLLKNVVDYGSGTNAYIDGYNVSGKTGTAQKFIDGKYSDSKYISSFASIFPSNNPKYVCVVSIDSPNKKKAKHWGNESAAPIIREVYKKIINTKNIKPETFIVNNDIIINTYNHLEKNDLGIVPNFKGKTLKQALITGKEFGLTIKPVGFSGRVVWQSIKAGSMIDNVEMCELKIE